MRASQLFVVSACAVAVMLVASCSGSSSCGPGTVLSGDQCIVDPSTMTADAHVSTPTTCGPGTHLVGTQCLADGASTSDGGISCGAGTHLVDAHCLPDMILTVTDAGVTITCGTGTHLVQGQCVADGSDGGVTCGPGTFQSGAQCLPNASGDAGTSITCGAGTVLTGAQCLPTITSDGGTGGITCGAGTQLVGSMCVATPLVGPPSSWTHVRAEVALPGTSRLSPSGRYLFYVPMLPPVSPATQYTLTTAYVRDVQSNTEISAGSVSLQCLISTCASSMAATSFSPDETRLLLAEVTSVSSDFVLTAYHVLDVSSGAKTTINLSSNAVRALIGWSPDSQSVLFLDTSFNVIKISVGSLTKTTVFSANPTIGLIPPVGFTSDGGSIVSIAANDAGVFQLLTAPMTGGGPTTVLLDGGLSTSPTSIFAMKVTSAGQVVYVGETTVNMPRLYARTLQSGATVNLSSCVPGTCSFSLSPSGTDALFMQTSTTWATVPISGGTVRPVSLPNIDSCVWAADDQLACRTTAGALSSYRVSTSTNTPITTGVSAFVAGAGKVVWFEQQGTLSLPFVYTATITLGTVKVWNNGVTTSLWPDITKERVPTDVVGATVAPVAPTDRAFSKIAVNIGFFDTVHNSAPGPHNGVWVAPLP